MTVAGIVALITALAGVAAAVVKLIQNNQLKAASPAGQAAEDTAAQDQISDAMAKGDVDKVRKELS